MVDQLAAAQERQLPVEDRRQLGNQVADAREPIEFIAFLSAPWARSDAGSA